VRCVRVLRTCAITPWSIERPARHRPQSISLRTALQEVPSPRIGDLFGHLLWMPEIVGREASTLADSHAGTVIDTYRRSNSLNTSESVVPSALASLSAWTTEGVLPTSRQESGLSMSGGARTVLTGRWHVPR
jgi:hypothetical protein